MVTSKQLCDSEKGSQFLKDLDIMPSHRGFIEVALRSSSYKCVAKGTKIHSLLVLGIFSVNALWEWGHLGPEYTTENC